MSKVVRRIDRPADDVLAAAREVARREGVSFADWIGRRLAEHERRDNRTAADSAKSSRAVMPRRASEHRIRLFSGLSQTLGELESALRDNGGDPVVNQALAQIEARLRTLAIGRRSQGEPEHDSGNRAHPDSRVKPPGVARPSPALDLDFSQLNAAFSPEHAPGARPNAEVWPPGASLSDMQNRIVELARQLDDMCRGASSSIESSGDYAGRAPTRADRSGARPSVDQRRENPSPATRTPSPQTGGDSRAGSRAGDWKASNPIGSERCGSADDRALFDRCAQRIEDRLGVLADMVERSIKGAGDARADALSGQLEAIRREITGGIDESRAATARQSDELTALVRSILVQGRPQTSAAMDNLEREMARVLADDSFASPQPPNPPTSRFDSQFEDLQGPAEEAAKTVQYGDPENHLKEWSDHLEPRLAREIAGLRVFQEEAALRTRLGARLAHGGEVQTSVKVEQLSNAVGTVQGRLGTLFGPSMAPSLERPPRRDRIEPSDISEQAGAERAQGVSPSPQHSAPEEGPGGADDVLIEPGGGVPLCRLERAIESAISPSRGPRAVHGEMGAAQPAQLDGAESPLDRLPALSLPAGLHFADETAPEAASPASSLQKPDCFNKRPVILALAAAATVFGAYALADVAAKQSAQSLAPGFLGEFAKKLFPVGTPPSVESRPGARAVEPHRGADTLSLYSGPALLDPRLVEPWSLAESGKPASLKSALAGSGEGAPKPAPGAFPMVPGPFEMSASASLSSPNQAKDVEARARFETGVRIARDTNSQQNMKVAAQYYELAAQQGLAAAQFRLAALFEKGLGVPRDMVRAKALYLAAAAQGHSKAMHNLGVLAAEGADGRPDYAGAAIWFEKAAQTGVRDSQFNFAVLLARGLGVARDLPRAYSLFALLANEGDAEAAKRRDDLAPRLTNAELAAAKATAAAFRPEPSDEAADERIATPARAPADSKPDVSGL